MKLIIGLGNPGDQYTLTRHNVGFLFLDYFKNKNDFSEFQFESRFKAEISNGFYEGEKCLLIKPQTFMNLSGESVKRVVDYYKVDTTDWIVIYDDISMDFGKIRYRQEGSAGGHNGIKDIIRLFNNVFNRVKVGVGQDDRYEVSDWVLSKFTQEEQTDLEDEIFIDCNKTLEEKF